MYICMYVCMYVCMSKCVALCRLYSYVFVAAAMLQVHSSNITYSKSAAIHVYIHSTSTIIRLLVRVWFMI